MLRKIIKPVSFFLVFSFLLLDFSMHTAQAKMIDTDTVLSVTSTAQNRAQVSAFLEREDVQAAMQQQGVDVVEAQKRVASLSDAELAKISQAMEQLPAGGSALGAIIGAAVFIFIVLLITDLLGLTHVFSFVRR
jgi:hypothetical protein